MSLAGASAALRYIDDHQKRAGTVTALVARGLADAVPSPPALPVTVSPPMTSAPPATVRDAEVKKYKGDDDCGAKPGDLGTSLNLPLDPCSHCKGQFDSGSFPF